MPGPIERPRLNRPQSPQPSGDRPPISRPQRPQISLGRDGNTPRPPGNSNGNNGGSGHGRNNNQPPSPWLNPENEPNPNQQASFVEYLRWMRDPCRNPDDKGKDYSDPTTKNQILQFATENPSKYDVRLKKLNERTKLIAKTGKTFEVTCPWRIRVGGHRGPESILLPAFDALGVPYIPSSTLRGIARTQAIRQVMKEKSLTWKKAEEDPLIIEHFGSLQAEAKNQAGKIVFLDAYPVASKCHLEMDMANNIWNWKDGQLNYSPNPNPFLSLKETTFLIGLRLISGCENQQFLKQVKIWLIQGLSNGAGSQINTGYGQLLENPKKSLSESFLKVEFTIEGQLIHGYQKFKNAKEPYKKDRDGKLKTDKNGKLQADGIAQTEVRPIAFKSMLRYWFRTFALGKMSARDTQSLEAELFGSIEPQALGLIKVNTIETHTQEQNEQQGILLISYSDQVQDEQKQDLKILIENLIWLMFYLGGIGQGARRPLYERYNNPKIRGSIFFIVKPDEFSKIPGIPQKFAETLQTKIKSLNSVLEIFKTKNNINSYPEQSSVSTHHWYDILDQDCQIFIVSGKSNKKCYALEVLHNQFHILEKEGKYSEMKSLCGGVNKDKIEIDGQKEERQVKTSPIWIRDLERFQIVTIFGATADPRKEYIKRLKENSEQYFQVFPLSQK